MTRRPLALLLLVPIACAAPRQSWREVLVPEMALEVLPRSAEVEVDGQPAGTGSRTVKLPDPARLYRLRVTAPGYEPAELFGDGRTWAGARVTLALRPAGFGTGRRLDGADGEGLAQAALVLVRSGRMEDARDYAERALETAQVPLAHKVLGAIYERRGDRKRAANHYSSYLALAPEAPDAKEIAAAVEKARGDLTIPGLGEAPRAQ